MRGFSWPGWALLLMAALAATLVAFSGDDGPRTWGFHFPQYLPLALRLIFLGLAGSTAGLMMSSRGRRIFELGFELVGRIVAAPTASRVRRRIGDVGVPLLFVCVCWLLRSRYAFLGDNWLRVDQAARGDFRLYEWGGLWLANLAIRAGEIFDIAPATAIAALNTIPALPYVCAAASLARDSTSTDAERGMFHLGLLSVGGVQLFCGYVEIYSWPMAAIAVFFAVLPRALRTRRWLAPVLVFAAGVFLHAVMLVFLPALVLMFLLRSRPSIRASALRASAALTLVLALAAPFAAPALLYGYRAAPGGFSLLAPAFWWERVNGWMLASLAGAALGSPLLVLEVTRLFRSRREVDTHRLLFLTAIVPSLIALSLMKTVLGAADWDILALGGVALFIWTAIAVKSLADEARGSRGRDPSRAMHRESEAGRVPWRAGLQPLLGGLVMFSLLNTFGFVIVNHGEASVRRIADIVAADRSPYFAAHPPALHLAFLYGANELENEEIRVIEAGIARDPADARLPHALAAAHFRHGRLDDAELWSARALLARSTYVPAIYLLFEIAKRRGDEEAAAAAANTIRDLHRRYPEMVRGYLDPRELGVVLGTSPTDQERAH